MGPHYSLLWHPYTGRLPAPTIDFSNMIDNSQHLSRPRLWAMLQTLLTVYEPYEPIAQPPSLAGTGAANAGFVPPSHCFLLQSAARSCAAAEAAFSWQFPNASPQQRGITGLPDRLSHFWHWDTECLWTRPRPSLSLSFTVKLSRSCISVVTDQKSAEPNVVS